MPVSSACRALALAACLFPLLSQKASAAPTLSDTLALRYDAYVQWCAPEKLYAHLDRTCYTVGETIWFRGYLQNASQRSMLPLSRYIYAELLDAKGHAVTRVKVKEEDGIFPGYLKVPGSLETGFYTFRAYSQSQLNVPSDYLFNERIRVVGDKKKKMIPPKTNPRDVRLSFYPESGRYFAGVRSTIAVKATDKAGRSVDCEGRVVDAAGQTLARFLTVHDGMGKMEFTPEANTKYFVETASGKRFPLPAPATDGAVIRLRIEASSYLISVVGQGEGKASLLLRDAGALTPLTNLKLDGRVQTFRVEKSEFRPGINHLLLVDSRGMILAERLFFVYGTSIPRCSVTPTDFIAYPRSLVKAEVSLADADGNALTGDCSVSVTRAVLEHWQQSSGILSYLGLSSELAGTINSPDWYFDAQTPLANRIRAMDLLMMIQGWRYYDLDQMFKLVGGKVSAKYARETKQTVRGSIRRFISRKPPKHFSFNLMVPKLKFYRSVQVDQADSYVIDSLDFEENTGFVIKIASSRVGMDYIPKWDGDRLAPSFLYKGAPGYASDTRSHQREASLGGISADTLKAAVVVADAGESDVLSYGTSYTDELSSYAHMTLIEYVQMKKASFEYDGDKMINYSGRAGRGNPGSRHALKMISDESGGIGSDDDGFESDGGIGKGAVRLMVNGNDEPWWNYDMVYMDEVQSINISSAAGGGVVSITMKKLKPRDALERDPSILYFVPLGYQVPQTFSSPRYDLGDAEFIDNRNTVFWTPSLRIENGKAEILFCNTDLQDFPYIVRVEGLTSDGRPFSKHCTLMPKE
ncbi:MAG: hypothetical protein J6Y32_05440 [Bacteroidales bacterium]|nr:hypothetical protein [Bacteroidales bacterium]